MTKINKYLHIDEIEQNEIKYFPFIFYKFLFVRFKGIFIWENIENKDYIPMECYLQTILLEILICRGTSFKTNNLNDGFLYKKLAK